MCSRCPPPLWAKRVSRRMLTSLMIQVVQEDLGHRLLVQVRAVPRSGHLRRRGVPQQLQGSAPGAVHVPQGVEDDVLGGDGGAQVVQQQHRRRPDGRVLPLRQGLRHAQQLVALPVGQHLQGQGRGGLQQLEGRLVLQPLGPAVVAQKRLEKLPPPIRLALFQQGVDHHLQREVDPPPVLGHQLVVRVDDFFQVELPLVDIRDCPAVRGPAGGLLLHVPGVEPGDDLPHEGGGLAADVPLPVHQQLVEEGQGLDLLGQAQIDGVGLKHAQVCPQLPPVGLPPRQLQQAGEAPLPGQAAHQRHVVLHAQQAQGLHGLGLLHERHVLFGGGPGGGAGEGGVHPQADHVALKVPQLGVDEGIAGPLLLGDVVQLAEDHVEGVLQCGDFGDLPAVGPPLLLHPEVGVDEHQGLNGQVVQLQVPDRVVGGHVADIRHVPPPEPEVGIVVVEVGHPLPRPAAELADVVARGAAGDQPQIDGRPGPLQIPGRAEGDVVDPRDVLQGAPGGGLQPQAHHLIDVLPPVGAQEQPVAVPVGAVRQLLLLQQLQLPHGVRRQLGPLRVKEHLEQGEEEHRPGAVLLLPLLKGRLREHGCPGEVVGKGNPPLLRLRTEAAQLLPAQCQHVPAPDAAPVIERHKALKVVLSLQKLRHHLPVGRQIAEVGLGGQPPKQAGRHLPDAFLVHGSASLLVSILFLERKRIKKNFLRETAFRFCPGYIMHQVPARSKGHGGKFPGSGPVSLEIPGSWAENPAIPPSSAAPPDTDAG